MSVWMISCDLIKIMYNNLRNRFIGQTLWTREEYAYVMNKGAIQV